jgi:hypothetical protein
MKQMMNEVNPKAGTLKQTNGKTLQNVSRKLIAFVLMLAIALQPAMVNAKTNDENGDTCCSVEKKDRTNKFTKLVKLSLPSEKMINKADSDITSSLYKSLNENRVKQFAEAFAAGDTEINKAFNAETSISLPESMKADEVMITGFFAENISFQGDEAVGDAAMTKQFAAEHRIQFTNDAIAGDNWMNVRFQAENITLPTTVMFAQADAEMHDRLQADPSVRTLAIK